MDEKTKSETSRPSRAGSYTDRRARGADWAVGIAAATLLLVSLGGYLYHRDQLLAISREHLRVRVCAPPSLGIGRQAEFRVLTTGIRGEPVSAAVEIALLTFDGEPVLHHTSRTADDGLLQVPIPPQHDLPEQGLRLEVTAARNGSRETLEARLASDPVRYTTCLMTDRASYKPGEKVYYRSVTLGSFDLAAANGLPVQFALYDAAGNIVPQTRHKSAISRGVCSGAFQTSTDLPPGLYALVASSPTLQFPEVRRSVTIVRRSVTMANPKKDNATSDPASTASADVNVAFHPESGRLAPHLENRVYFTARDQRGEPVDLRGLLVDAEDTPVAAVETLGPGVGTFSFIPMPRGRYRLKISEPAGVTSEPELPEIDRRRDVVLSTGVGVFGAGQPLELNLRAAEGGIPLVVAAWCRGLLVGQKPVPTRVVGADPPQTAVRGAGEVNPVTLQVPDKVSGLIRLVAYDYRKSPPVPIAQRWVYRRPSGRLELSASTDIQALASGRRASVTLTVTDESGRRAPAVVAMAAVDKAMSRPRAASTPACFLLWSTAHSRLSDDVAILDASDDAEGDVALDLLLGTHDGLRETVAEPTAADTRPGFGTPPIVLDNLQPLRQKYQDVLDQYRRDRTRARNTLTTLSFFGGLGLVFAVAMLGLLDVVGGLRLWIPAAGTAVCCLLIGAILLAPLRGDAPHEGDTAFQSFHGPSLPDAPPPPVVDPAIGHVERPTEAAHQFAYEHGMDEAGDWGETGGLLFWDPFVVVGDDGLAEVHFDLPDSTSAICLRADAHNAGRLGTLCTCPPATDPIY